MKMKFHSSLTKVIGFKKILSLIIQFLFFSLSFLTSQRELEWTHLRRLLRKHSLFTCNISYDLVKFEVDSYRQTR